ncbi:GH-E family nuclease [Microlunatus sp. GCM10028923]|uniref:GH-E family nuclease n=1 Tax=Microlunatus sp. GCM10028923 TaxID=3273400 RepID=UPI003605BB9A
MNTAGIKFVGRLAGAVLLSLLAILLGASPASANPDDDLDKVRGVCATSDGTTDYQYLPVERWSGATQQLHVRTGGGTPFDLGPFQRQMQGSTFAAGDFLYSVTTKFVMWSTDFCPLESVGATIDNAAAQFGRSLLGSPLLAGVVALAVIGLLVQGMRREAGWMARLLVKMVIIGALVMMVVGASNSRVDSSGNFEPGEGSPGWFATMIDQAITEIAAAPAAALNTPRIEDGIGVDTDQLSCGAYVNALRKGYDASAQRGGALIDAKSIPAQTVSNLWQVSGYRAWSVGQFGRDNLNGQNRVACRMLDHNAGIPAGVVTYVVEGQGVTENESVATRADVMSRVPEKRLPITQARVNPSAPAWKPLNRQEQDQAWIAWAACVPQDGLLENLDKPDGWRAPRGQEWLIKAKAERVGAAEGRSQAFDRACFDFFNTPGEEVNDIFDWGDGDGELKKVAGDMPASIYDFISALHGTNQVASSSAVIGYMLSAIGVAAVFGTLGAAIMIVKSVAAFMLLSVIFVALLCLLPRGDNHRLIRFVKIYVGLSLTAAFAIFIMSLVTLFTNVILNIIKNFAGPNSDMTLILGGLAPVMAAIALHFAFQKAGMPSPMSVRGAMAWGGSLSGGAGLGAIRTGGQQILDGARGLVNRGRGKGQEGESSASRPLRSLGKRNSELESTQAIPPRRQTSANGADMNSPETILNDPNSTPAQRAEAQRRRRAAAASAGRKAQESSENGGSGDSSGSIDPYPYKRPSRHRASVRAEVWPASVEPGTGRVRDPETGSFMSVNKSWDMGHKPGYEFRKHELSAVHRGISRAQFLDEHNDATRYRPDLPQSNRSRRSEDASGAFLG